MRTTIIFALPQLRERNRYTYLAASNCCRAICSFWSPLPECFIVPDRRNSICAYCESVKLGHNLLFCALKIHLSKLLIDLQIDFDLNMLFAIARAHRWCIALATTLHHMLLIEIHIFCHQTYTEKKNFPQQVFYQTNELAWERECKNGTHVSKEKFLAMCWEHLHVVVVTIVLTQINGADVCISIIGN